MNDNVKNISRDKFYSPDIMLHHIANDPSVKSFVIVIFDEDGETTPVYFDCKRSDFAYASVIL